MICISLIGWGEKNKKGNSTNVLLEVELSVADNEDCKEWWRDPPTRDTPTNITENQICARIEETKSTCRGDSGGPLTYKSGNQHVLIGATSTGPKHCGVDDAFIVFSRISQFREWIEGKMEAPRFCDGGADVVIGIILCNIFLICIG